MQQLKFFGCLLAIVAIIAPLYGNSLSFMGDTQIYVSNAIWKCDQIFCPAETYLCRVTKQKLQPHATQFERVNTCYHSNNTVLLEATSYDSIGAAENISLNVTSYRPSSVWYSISSSDVINGGCFR